jgi:hypothetical protein
MKNVLFILVAAGLLIVFQSNMMISEKKTFRASEIEMPADIKTIVDKSCYGCHNTESRSEKGKAKLKWDKLNDLSKAKQVAVLETIIGAIKEDAMPPENFRERYPDNVPTKGDAKKLMEWADAQADKIMGN